ncbi:hypothetical protein DMN91_011279 [Ooceraea biroi]|uniref:Uncharacterized protein n=1 Tax=Ooceraea biroi TaxID=2015173 RepID=A0A026WWK4_OOCBI|nr:pilosulin-1 [Ooceraea biroi]EZA60203.1 hypothetical protein X777_13291 [Ooceraea biroi]RLU17210.1 hypothetical protein DMN91_011279 [Ooceraea biroi]
MKPLCFSLVLAVIFVLAIVHAEAKPLADAGDNADDGDTVPETDIGTGLKSVLKLIIRAAKKMFKKLAPTIGEEAAAKLVIGQVTGTKK